MRKVQYKIIWLCLSTLCISCASTWREKTLSYMGGAFTGGAVLGVTQAGEDQDKTKHAMLWAGLSSAAVGAAMVYLQDEDQSLSSAQRRIKELELRQKSQRMTDYKNNQEVMSPVSGSLYESKLPEELNTLVKPGKWKLYRIDEWKKMRDGSLVHQDKLLEIENPEINL